MIKNLEEYEERQRNIFFRKLQLEELKEESKGWIPDRDEVFEKGPKGELTERTLQLRRIEQNKSA